MIVTIIGWGWTIKGTLYMLFPALPRRVSSEHLKHPQRFRWAGAAILIPAGLVIWRLITADLSGGSI